MKIKIPSEIWVELYSEIASEMINYSALDNITKIMDNGDECYTDEAQEKFNDCAELAEGMLEDFFIKGE